MNLLETTRDILKKYKVLTPHALKTLYWVKEIDPQASEIVLSAALAHDIGRAIFPLMDMIKIYKSHRGDDPAYLKHQRVGAEVIKKELMARGVDEKTASEVAKIVKYHERGGWYEADLVKDADSLSFLETNAIRFLEDPKYEKIFGWDKIREKFNWMYNRITIERARELAKPMYEKAMKMLEEKEKSA